MTIPNVQIGPLDLVTMLPYLSLAIMFGIVLAVVPLLTWFERVVLGLFHDRPGPNRVGPRGILQPIADGIKLFFKEDILPTSVDRRIYYLAPVLALMPPLASCAVIPITELRIRMADGTIRTLPMVAADVNIGVLWVFGLAALQVYGIVLGGWSSNNKYSLLGGLRSSAQSISYELAMSLTILTAVLMAGSLSLVEIVQAQSGGIFSWNILRWFPLGFVAAIVYGISMVAETNRAPFDLPEAESELVAGFQTEYSSMKFAVFFMSEYASMVVVSAMATVLWLGGWQAPAPGLTIIPGVVWFFGKIALIIFTYVWVRATLPRFRYDALMRFGWKRLFPVALAVLMLGAVVDAYYTSPTAKSAIPAKPERPKPNMMGAEGAG